MISVFRRKLEQGLVMGNFSKTSDHAFIEVMGHGGFDFVILDLEHSPNSVETVQNLIRACEVADIIPIIRVKEDRFSVIGEALDIGAGGIQVPQVTDASTARRVIEHAKFAPAGMRGVCRFVRAAGYSSMDRYRYFTEANKTLVVLQLEGRQALENLEDILEVQGVDVLFIGPYDLSQSLGVPGRVDDPGVEKMMAQICGRCREKGIAAGMFVDTIENARKWKRAGIRYLAYSVDVGLFLEKCRETVQRITP
jgi:4-hydroxy-2-oxoheptanedioate aldolase